MEWLNYHHLFYFWTVARAGSIAKASQELRLAQPTISNQLKTLEGSLGREAARASGAAARPHGRRAHGPPLLRTTSSEPGASCSGP